MGRKRAAASATNSDQPKPTQKEMLKQALDAGVNPKSNIDLADWIRQNHGVKLEPQIVANLKFQLQKQASKPSAVIRARSPIAPVAAKPIKPTATGDALELVLKVNSLIEECGGADRLKQLVDVIAKPLF